MKLSSIKMAFNIVVFASIFNLQSCKKEATGITPINTTIIGTWKTVLSSGKILERQFIKGAANNAGTGITRIIAPGSNNAVTTTTSPFNWDTEGNHLHLENIADVGFIFEITADGKKLILFDEVNTNQVSFTFERVN